MDGGGLHGTGGAGLVVARQAGVRDPDGVGGAGISGHVIGAHIFGVGPTAVFVDCVASHVSGEGLKALGRALFIDHNRLSRAVAAADEDKFHVAGSAQVQRQGRAGIHPGAGLAPTGFRAVAVDLGFAGDGIFGAGAVGDLGGFGLGHGDDAADTLGVGEEGADLLTLQHQRALQAVERAVGGLVPGHLVKGAVGEEHGGFLAVGAPGVGGHQHHVGHGGQSGGGQEGAGGLLPLDVRPKEVVKENGGVASVERGISLCGVHPVGEADGGGKGQIAVRPHAADVLVLVPQDPEENGGRLPQSDGAVRIELTVGKAGDGVFAFGGHIDVGRRPVGGLHIRVDGDGAIEAQLVFGVKRADHHFTKLCPGELTVGAEIPVGKAVHHAHEPQGLHRCVGVAVQVVKTVGGRSGLGGQDQQGRRHGHKKQQGQDACFHNLPPLEWNFKNAGL